jgi:hypothetical protein
MRFKWIVCKTLQKEAYFCAARSPHIVDVVLMPQGLHNTPQILCAEVQKELSRTIDNQGNPYDAILMGYGLCGNGILGLTSPIKLIVPRAHDCVTLLLGSKEKYQQYLDTHRGVYWYSDGWIRTQTMPGKVRYEALLAEYTEKFGPDNAEYLLEIEQSWMKEYNWAVYIDWNLPESPRQKDYTRQCAEYLGWQYDCVAGSPDLLQRLTDGLWNEQDFLIVQPGAMIVEDLTQPGLIKTSL